MNALKLYSRLPAPRANCSLSCYRRTIRRFGKTPGSLSKVHLPDGLAGELRRWKLECKDRAPEAFIFPNADGGCIDTANYRFRVLKPLADKLGIERLNFQILRRTMATQAQRMGSVKDIQAHLRHARPDTTAFEYMQELPDSVQEMVGSMYEKLKKGGAPKKGVARLLPNATKAPKEKSVSY